MAIKKFDTEDLKRHLSYDPETGKFTWRIGRNGFVKANAEAGTLAANGYVVIGFGRATYLAHRLAYAFVHSEQPPLIDHINGDRSDNRIANLRAASRSLNAQNQRIDAPKGRTGVLGVTFDKQANKFRAHIAVNGARPYLGRFDSLEAAAAAVAEARALYHPGRPV